MRSVYNYPYIEPQTKVYKPWIPVLLAYKKTHKIFPQKVLALIDSGADVCFCSENLAAYLGAMNDSLKDRDLKVFTAANQTTFKAYKQLLTIHICEREYQCPFFITGELPHTTPIILGQKGFFNHHQVTFDLPHRLITLSPNTVE